MLCERSIYFVAMECFAWIQIRNLQCIYFTNGILHLKFYYLLKANFLFFFKKPIRHPGPMNFKLNGRNTRTISGKVRSDVKIDRTISGLTAVVKCYLVNGNNVGSCIYDGKSQTYLILFQIKYLPIVSYERLVRSNE